MDVILSILTFASVSVLAWALLPDNARRLVRRRLHSEVEAPQPSSLSHVARWLAPLHRRLPLKGYADRMTRLIEGAGLRLPVLHFLVIQELGALTGFMIYCVTIGTAGLNLVWLVFFLVIGFFMPVYWMRNQAVTRRLTIGRDLPEVVDLLTLCVGAGMDFMNALARIVREFRPCPVREELGIILQEIRLGKRRRDALRAFSLRLNTAESSIFARTLIQADRMGIGFAEALMVLAEDMRNQRAHWADRFAQQAPLKMLLPLMLSLGSALLIVAGPILIQFFRGGFVPNMSAPQGTEARQ